MRHFRQQSSMTSDQSTHWGAVLTLFLAGSLAAFQYAKIPFMLAGLGQQIPMSLLQQAWLLSIIGVVGALAGTFFAALCRAIGIRQALLMGLFIGSLGAMLPLWVTNYPLLLAARLIEGIAHMAIVISVPTLLLPYSAVQDRPKVMAIWSCYFTSTFIVAALMAPLILDLAGWQGFAWLHAGLLLIAMIGCARLPKLQAPVASNLPKLNTKQLLVTQWRLLSEPKLLAVPLTFLGYTLLFVTLVSQVPTLVTSTVTASHRLAFLLPCAALLGTIISLLCLRRAIPSTHLVNIAAIGLMVLAVFLSLLPASHAITIALLGLVFLLLGMLPAGIISTLPSLFQANDPDVALVNGGIAQFGNLGNFVGAPILAFLLSRLGWLSVGLYLAAGALFVLLCLILLRRQARLA